MPNYEYRCLNCRKRFEVFMSYAEYGTRAITCPFCNSADVQRRIGRIRVARSDSNRMENLAEPSNLANIDEDPRALGKMMRQMSSEIGENMGPEFDEVVHRLEKGQSPDQIEQELPDLSNSLAGSEGGFDPGDGFDDM